MALTRGIVPDAPGTSTTREPLQPRTASPPTLLTKRIRRRSSFIRQPDSSEDYPSPHESIYEAVYFSGTNSDSSGNRVELIDIPPPRRSGTVVVPTVNTQSEWDIQILKSLQSPAKEQTNNENIKLSSDVPAQVEFRYGWGTPLETITEQRSCNTLRTLRTTSRAGRPKSADDIVPSFLGHRDSFILAKTPRRKASFSLDDMSYHEACATIARSSLLSQMDRDIQISEVYAEPKEPVRAPPDRPPTPDGMPSWTAAQNVRSPVLTMAEQNAFQRFFGLPATRTRITFSSRIPQPSIQLRDRAVSAPVRGRIAPRFRPPRSAYGPIDQHPFANTPIAQVKSTSQTGPAQASGSGTTSAIARPRRGKRKLQRVRFTPSATARDSEVMTLQAAIESTSSLAIHPLSPIPPMVPSPISIQPPTGACPHRKGRKTSQGPATNVEPQSSTLIGTSTLASNSTRSLVTDDLDASRTTSFGSTAFLMPRGLRSPSGSTMQFTTTPQRTGPEQKERFCWKCAAAKAGDKFDNLRKGWGSCLCFVCCGINTYDDESTQHNGSNSGYGPYLRRTTSQDYLGPRRVTLNHSPAGIP